jgi:hypothetical protein
MTSESLQLFVNMDLSESVFNRITLAYLKYSGAESCKYMNFDDFKESSVSATTQIEVLVMFARTGSTQGANIDSTLGQLDTLLNTINDKQLKHSVKFFKLVDCGDEYAAPLTDFLIISQYLEEVSLRVTDGVEGSVLAADYTSDDSEESHVEIRDTSSQEFLEHMVGHIQQSLTAINLNFGAGDLPDVGHTSQNEVAEALSEFLTEKFGGVNRKSW